MENLCSRCNQHSPHPGRKVCRECVAAEDRERRAAKKAVQRLEPIEVPERLRRLLREHWEGAK